MMLIRGHPATPRIACGSFARADSSIKSFNLTYQLVIGIIVPRIHQITLIDYNYGKSNT